MTFNVGETCRVNGTPLHHAHIVTVVDPMAKLLKARAEAKATGRKLSEGTTYRAGLIAAFDPAYPLTLWWWFAPHQLTKVEQ